MDNLEKKEMGNEDSRIYYSTRLELLFETDLPVSKETLKNFFLAMLGSRFVNLRVKTKKYQMMDITPEDGDFKA